MTDISALISAVKPRERTDQYVILAALLTLGAHVSGVTAKEVSTVLRLHLRNKVPSNVSASLRAYTAYVTPLDQGPPILWGLTAQGVERLRALSGLPISIATDQDSFKSDIGVVCALEHPELLAVMNASGGISKWSEVGDTRHTHIYRETEISTAEGKTLRVVATTATSMGLTAAAIATTHLILEFRPRLITMIGIAAGTRSGGKQFGDVLVADPSVDYNSGKVVLADGIREFQPDPYPIGLVPRMRSVLHKYRAAHVVFDEIRGRWSRPLPPGPNRAHVGPVGAADQVIDDASRVLEIQKNWRKLIGVEMETYGVYRAANEAPEPRPRVVSFKAVCDFAAEKADSWQDYAAFMAAEFAFEFFKREWASLWPKT
jgi:nucleoside phosphorylase